MSSPHHKSVIAQRFYGLRYPQASTESPKHLPGVFRFCRYEWYFLQPANAQKYITRVRLRLATGPGVDGADEKNKKEHLALGS